MSKRERRETRLRRTQPTREQVSVGLLIAFIIVVFATGGAARSDEPQQIVVRLAAIAFGAAALMRLTPQEARRVRAPLGFLLAAAALVAAQLVPLPPALWEALPGRAPFVVLGPLAGFGTIWRPLSLVPDGGLNALAALLPPIAGVLLVASVQGKPRIIVRLLVSATIASAVIALLQVGDALPSFYGFRAKGFGGAVGVFANRNHHAALLSAALPMLGYLAAVERDGVLARYRGPVAAVAAALILTTILLTGSRSGVILAFVGVAGAALVYLSAGKRDDPLRTGGGLAKLAGKGGPAVAAAVVIAAIAAVALLGLLARADILQRLVQDDVRQDLRLTLFGPMVDIGRQYFPAGTGFGSFEKVFELHERLQDLDLSYLNHAHNDLLELFIEGGLPGLVLLALGLAWGMRAGWRAWSTPADPADTVTAARLASVVAVVILLASLSDYPLRTPLMMVVLAIVATFARGTSSPENNRLTPLGGRQ